MSDSPRDPAPRRARAVSCIFCLVLLAVATPLLAADIPATTNELTLDEAVRRAVGNAPQIEASGARIEAATLDQQRAGRLPDPMLVFGVDDLPVSGADAFDPDADAMTQKSFGLRQDLPAAAKRRAQRNVAARALEVSQAEAGVARLDVARAAANAWVDAWSVQRERSALLVLRDQARLALQLARARVAGGDAVLDALAAEAAVLDLEGEAAAAEGTEIAALAELRRWIGEGDFTLATGSPGFDVVPRAEAAALAAIDRQPALRAARAKVDSAEAALEAARAERHPDWNVAASYGQRSGFDDMLMVEVGVSLPIFTRNRQSPGIAARLAEQREAFAALEGLRREMTARTHAAYARWDGLRRRATTHERVLQLAQQRSAAALASYRAGSELRAWLDARRDEAGAHRDHARHLADLARTWIDLAFLYEEQAP
jgi:outer membrane protein TolC